MDARDDSTKTASLAEASQKIEALSTLKEVKIKDPLVVIEKIVALTKAGTQKLHVITDFDMTLTKYWVNGERNMASHSVLTKCSGVSQNFIDQKKATVDKYYPYEISTTISQEEKLSKMIEWWTKAHEVYIAEGISRSYIKDAVKEFYMTYREKAIELIHQTGKYDIPLLVFSAGIADVIEELLGAKGLLQSHVHVVSNSMIYDKSPPYHCIGFQEPLIHVLNKAEVKLQGTAFFEAVANRPNAILLGDSLGDTDMGASLAHDTVLTIGFLNFNTQELLPFFLEKFDIVITGDSSFAPVLEILEQVANN